MCNRVFWRPLVAIVEYGFILRKGETPPTHTTGQGSPSTGPGHPSFQEYSSETKAQTVLGLDWFFQRAFYSLFLPYTFKFSCVSH